MNPAPNSTREVFKELPSNMSLGALDYLEQVNILETLEYDVEQASSKRLTFIQEDTSLLSIGHMV